MLTSKSFSYTEAISWAIRMLYKHATIFLSLLAAGWLFTIFMFSISKPSGNLLPVELLYPGKLAIILLFSYIISVIGMAAYKGESTSLKTNFDIKVFLKYSLLQIVKFTVSGIVLAIFAVSFATFFSVALWSVHSSLSIWTLFIKSFYICAVFLPFLWFYSQYFFLGFALLDKETTSIAKDIQITHFSKSYFLQILKLVLPSIILEIVSSHLLLRWEGSCVWHPQIIIMVLTQLTLIMVLTLISVHIYYQLKGTTRQNRTTD